MKHLHKHKLKMLILSFLLMLTNIPPITVHAEPEETQPTNPGETQPTDPGSNENTDPDETPTVPEENEPTQEEPETPVYIPSSNNWLSSLSVEGVSLEPEFSSNVLEYTIVLKADVTSVKIDAAADHYYASIDGTGTFDVSYESGNKDFIVVCKAENGAKREYTIHVTFNTDPVLFTNLNGENLGFVIKDLDKLKAPEGFTMQTGIYQDKKITVFVNEGFPFDLVYLQNDIKKADWYCYQNGEVTDIFRTLVINKNKYFYAGITNDIRKQSGYSYSQLNVVGEKINGWKVNGSGNENKVMLYLYDSTGNADFYIYNTDDQILQNRREFEVGIKKNQRNPFFSPLAITIAIIVVIAVAFMFIIAGANNDHSIKEIIQTLLYRLKNKKSLKKTKAPVNDDSIELVRTSKVHIYPAPQNETENKDSSELAVTQSNQETFVKQDKVEKEMVSNTEETPKNKKKNPIKKKKINKSKQEIEKTEDASETENTSKINLGKFKNLSKRNNSSEKKALSKKSKVSKKTKNQKQTKPAVKNEVDKAFEVVEKESKATEPFVNAKTNDYTDMSDIDPMSEIQKYIDQLFYLSDDQKEHK